MERKHTQRRDAYKEGTHTERRKRNRLQRDNIYGKENINNAQ